jgi:hypothetical protein
LFVCNFKHCMHVTAAQAGRPQGGLCRRQCSADAPLPHRLRSLVPLRGDSRGGAHALARQGAGRAAGLGLGLGLDLRRWACCPNPNTNPKPRRWARCARQSPAPRASAPRREPGRNFFLLVPTKVDTSVGWAALHLPQCGGTVAVHSSVSL